ncbi:hypothetical protein SCB49_08638 [unidentified eubacterium SCB49]|nr:hypothetical protein SCB49_08638 [unidentified eubacterium SCB49]
MQNKDFETLKLIYRSAGFRNKKTTQINVWFLLLDFEI